MLKAIIFDITGVLFPHQPWIGEWLPLEELMKIKRVAIDIYDQEKMCKRYLKKKFLRLIVRMKNYGRSITVWLVYK